MKSFKISAICGSQSLVVLLITLRCYWPLINYDIPLLIHCQYRRGQTRDNSYDRPPPYSPLLCPSHRIPDPRSSARHQGTCWVLDGRTQRPGQRSPVLDRSWPTISSRGLVHRDYGRGNAPVGEPIPHRRRPRFLESHALASLLGRDCLR